MRPDKTAVRIPAALVLALLVGFVTIGLRSGALLPSAGPEGVSWTGEASAQTPSEAVERARGLLADGLYREALDILDGLDPQDTAGVEPRHLRLLRATAALRWSRLPGVSAPERASTAERELVELVETEDDDAAALAYAELLRAGARGDVLERYRDRTLAHWESATDVTAARAPYADLLEAFLVSGTPVPLPQDRGILRMRVAPPAPVNATILVRMWENLVAAELPAPRRSDLAALVLVGQSERPEPRRWSWGSHRGVDDVLAREVARDVVALGGPDWLRGAARVVLGQLAEAEGEYAVAVEHYRSARSLVADEVSGVAERIDQALRRLLDPTVALSGPQLYRPGSEHRLDVQWRNLRSWELRVRRVDPREDLRLPEEMDHDTGALFAEDAGEVVARRSRTDEQEVAARDAERPSRERHRPRADSLRLEPLGAGVYLVEFEGRGFDDGAEPVRTRHLVVVGGLGVVQQTRFDAERQEDVTDFWVVSMDDGRPVDDLDLVVHRGFRRDDAPRLRWTHRELRTDDDGRVVLGRDEDVARRVLVVGEHDGQPIFFPGQPLYGHHGTARSQLRGLVWTDRPLYRPGDTVHLQAFVRRLDVRAREVAVPEDREVRVTVRDPRGEPLLERDVRLDANGSFSIETELSGAPALGDYRVQVWTSERENAAQGSFRVDEVRLPEFTVEVGLDRDTRSVLGDTLEVEIRAAYLFGGGVEGTAEVVVHRRPVWTFWGPRPWLPWIDEDEPGAGRFATSPGRAGIVPPIHAGPGTEVLRTTVALDEEGVARLAVPTERRASEPGDFQYTIEARVTDPSRREETGRGTIKVGEHELVAFLRAERHVVGPGERAEVVLRVQDVMDRGVEHEGRWRLEFVDPEGEVRTLREEKIRTAPDGEATIGFEPERIGHYRVHYESVDGRGFAIEASTVVWVADPRTRDLPFAAGAVELIVEREEFLGDTARVLLVTDTPGATVMLTRTHAGGSEVEFLRLRGSARLLELPLDDLHRPSFDLVATRVHDWRVHEDRVRVVAPQAQRLLQLDLEFAEDEVEPGRLVPLRVRATDAQGDPVSTVLSLAVVDRAVLQVAPRPPLDPVRTFHHFPRTPQPRRSLLSSSLGTYHWLDEETEEESPAPEPRFGGLEKASPEMAADGALATRQFARRTAVAEDVAGAPPAPADGGGETAFEPESVRTDFRRTALWRVDVRTDADGRAVIDVPLAESLTTWDATVLAVDPDSRTGVAETSVRTRKPVMVRLNHPRVFREGDRFVASAVVHNENGDEVEALVQLEAEGLVEGPRTRRVLLPAHGQGRVQWDLAVADERLRPVLVRDEQGRVVGTEPAAVDLRVAVRSVLGNDAFERRVPLLAFGTGVHLAAIAEMGEGERSLRLDVPSDRLSGSETVTLTVRPSLLSTAVDALPYLADYPYGCTEQTLSRFAPAVAVRAAAVRLGADPGHFDPDLDAKIEQGLQRIVSQQNPDGSWSWWKEGSPDPYITAHVLLGLTRAEHDGVDVDRRVIRSGREALRRMLPELENRRDDLAYALLALAEADGVLHADGLARVDDVMRRWTGRLLDARDELGAYARALLVRVLARHGQDDRAALVLRHLGNDVQRDDVLGTAHWGRVQGYWWRGEGAVETTAFVLQAMVEVRPDHPLRDDVARWLVHNRRGHRWDSTRSTAHALYALCDHVAGTEATPPDYTLVARSGGEELLRVRVTADDLLRAGGTYPLPASILRDGATEVALSLEGTGTAWVTLEADLFTRAEDLRPQGHVREIEREVVRLVPRRTLGQGVVEFEEPLRDGDAIRSGERLRVRLRLRARHDVDYVVIEDPRPAGTEPVQVLSGPFWGEGIGGRREVRDAHTAFFVDRVREGEHRIEYELRAESPGSYRVTPARALAMYLPDVAGHSASDALVVRAVGESGGSGR